MIGDHATTPVVTPTAPATPTRRGAIVAALPMLAAICLVVIGNAVMGTFTSLRLAAIGAPAGVTGFVITGYPVGFLLGGLLARRIIERSGHGAGFRLFALLTALATAALTLGDDCVVWSFLRAINGFAAALLFTTAESWFNIQSPGPRRGSVMAAYMTLNMLSAAAGQYLIPLDEPTASTLILVSAALYALALAPLGRRRLRQPAVARATSFSAIRLARAAPLAVAAVFISGMTNLSVLFLAPLYGVARGLDPTTIASLITAVTLGAMVAQTPVGWASDRFGRRGILTVLALITAVADLGLWLAGSAPPAALIALLGLYGAASFSLYPVAIAHANDSLEGRHAVAISGLLLLAFALGGVIGPPLANQAMSLIGPGALFGYTGVNALALLGLGVGLMSRRRGGVGRAGDHRAGGLGTS